MASGHYTFRVLLSIEEGSETKARDHLIGLLDEVQGGSALSGYGVEGLAPDLTYNDEGELRNPSEEVTD